MPLVVMLLTTAVYDPPPLTTFSTLPFEFHHAYPYSTQVPICHTLGVSWTRQDQEGKDKIES